MIKKLRVVLAGTLCTVLLMTGCTVNTSPQAQTSQAELPSKSTAAEIILATTTSTQQTGLLDELVPMFTNATGIPVKVVAVGSGQALEMGKAGEADVLLVHAKASEEAFVKEGYGIERFDVMYNDFVLLGNKPIDNMDSKAILDQLKYISEQQLPFISRGDDSGTHKKELALWKKISIEPKGNWYISAGKGMGEVIQMADEKQAFTLSDRGTYLSMKSKVSLQIVSEGSKDLLNQYGVIVVSPAKNPKVHAEEAQKFSEWIRSKEIQQWIGEFGIKTYGEPLFIPNAKE